MTDQNPYKAPISTPPANAPARNRESIALDLKDRKKINALIKDAGQFWLAIILCIICSAIGSLIIPIWYLVRLLQWNSFAKKYPALLADGAPAGSIQASFKAAKWKLLTGLIFGLVMIALLTAYVLILILTPAG